MPFLLNIDNMNQSVRAMKYDITGPISARSDEIEEELERGEKKAFKSLIRFDIGDPQAMGVKPLTWIRQTLAAVAYPPLLDEDRFPADVNDRARTLLNGFNGKTIGSYSDSSGYMVVKQCCAEFIRNRDGIDCDPETICLFGGVKSAVSSFFQILDNPEATGKLGVLIPIPSYPLYTAAITCMDFHPCYYYLNEGVNWSLDLDDLKRSLKDSRKVCIPKLLVVINPNNPTGMILTRDNIQDMIEIAYEEKLIIFVDEVYQQNIYKGEFLSFKKVLVEMGEPYSSIELISLMSTSKGFYGECGVRGAYMELFNMCPRIKEMISKMTTVLNLPPIMGQVALSCITLPPKPGDPSYDLFNEEKEATLKVFKERFEILHDVLDNMNGISCSSVSGTLFAFPRLDLPPKVLVEAKKHGQEPDEFFCFQLLNEVGVAVIPGSGFGQKPGTYHFRITNLVPYEEMRDFVKRFETLYNRFCE